MKYENVDGVDTYTLDPIHVTFVGCRGCGKTSLMASMFNEIQKKRISCVTADPTTMSIMSDSYADMLRMLEEAEENGIAKPTLDATEGKTVFKFIGTSIQDASFEKKRFHYPFEFTDLPGGWYAENAANYVKKVDAELGKSSVCLLAIDAPALMSGDYTHQLYNRPDTILNWFNKSLGLLKDKNVRVVFVLSRCETFVQNEDSRREIFERVRQSYAPLIDVLRTAGIDICGTWVETLGGVQFLNYRRNAEGIKVPVFQKTGDYAPRNCEIPLLLTLQQNAESMKLALVQKRGPWRVLLDWLGVSHYDLAIKGLEEILRELERGLSMAKDEAMFEL